MAIPTDYSGLLYWVNVNANEHYLDAGVTHASSGNDPIYRFGDIGGSANHWQQTTLGLRPVYDLSWNAILIPGGGQYFTLPNLFAGLTAAEILWLIKLPYTNQARGFIHFNTSTFNSHLTYSDGHTLDGTLTTNRQDMGVLTGQTNWHCYSSASGATWAAYKDDGTTPINAPVASTYQADNATPRVGVSRDAGSYQWHAWVAQAAAYNRILTNTERTALFTTWGAEATARNAAGIYTGTLALPSATAKAMLRQETPNLPSFRPGQDLGAKLLLSPAGSAAGEGVTRGQLFPLGSR